MFYIGINFFVYKIKYHTNNTQTTQNCTKIHIMNVGENGNIHKENHKYTQKVRKISKISNKFA